MYGCFLSFGGLGVGMTDQTAVQPG